MLDQLVKNGNLPPVAERLPVPDDIYVVKPVDEVGIYGGTLKTTTLQPNSFGNDSVLTGFSNFNKPKTDGSGFVPEVAKKIESSSDKKVWTIHLRKGMKWSDGVPFIADDIMFWYNDVLLNKDLTPVVGIAMKTIDGVAKVKKIDDYTVEFIFPRPRPYFQNRLYLWHNIYPKHYLKKFHPAYTSKEELDKLVKQEGFDHWYELFNDKDQNWEGQPLNPDLPVLGPYVLVEKNSNRRIYERNPYFWKVDTAGNQLPYIDCIDTEVISTKEIGQGKILSGAVDFSGINTDIRNYPMYKKYEEKGNYNTYLWKSGYGSEANYFFNLTDKDPVLRKIFQDVRFRRALSLAINRQEINDSIYFGKAKPRQYTVLPTSHFYEPEFAEAYIKYDPAEANKLLDEMGLKDTDGDGWRDRPDGKTLTFTIEYYNLETPKEPNVQLVTEYWQQVGIDVSSRIISGELQSQRATGNLMDATLWHDGSAVDANFPIDPRHVVPTHPRWEECTFTEWARWFQTDGKSGEEPPAEIKKVRNWWDQMLVEPDEQKRIELGKKILAEQADKLWTIGTIGETPWPIIISKNIGNFPKMGRWAWGVQWLHSHDPSQLYLKK